MASNNINSEPNSNWGPSGGIQDQTATSQLAPIQTSLEHRATNSTSPTETVASNCTGNQTASPTNLVHQIPSTNTGTNFSATSDEITIQNSATSSNTSTPVNEKNIPTTSTVERTKPSPPSSRPFIILWPKPWWRHYVSDATTYPRWGIYWYSPLCMLGLTLIGIGAMVGHYLYNFKLHGHEVNDP